MGFITAQQAARKNSSSTGSCSNVVPFASSTRPSKTIAVHNIDGKQHDYHEDKARDNNIRASQNQVIRRYLLDETCGRNGKDDENCIATGLSSSYTCGLVKNRHTMNNADSIIGKRPSSATVISDIRSSSSSTTPDTRRSSSSTLSDARYCQRRERSERVRRDKGRCLIKNLLRTPSNKESEVLKLNIILSLLLGILIVLKVLEQVDFTRSGRDSFHFLEGGASNLRGKYYDKQNNDNSAFQGIVTISENDSKFNALDYYHVRDESDFDSVIIDWQQTPTRKSIFDVPLRR